MMDPYRSGQGSQPPYRASVPTSSVRRSEWDRRDPHGFIRMALVFVGAFIGGFVVWPMIRPAFVADDQPQYADDARFDAPLPPPSGNRRAHR